MQSDEHISPTARLRSVVGDKLALEWSPEQIARWLRRAFPDDAEMRVSHETIYLSLFVQTRGALRRQLVERLRSGQRCDAPGRRCPACGCP